MMYIDNTCNTPSLMAPFELEPIPTPINLKSNNDIGNVVRICTSPKADKNTLFKCLKVNKNTTTKLAMAYFKSLYYLYLYQSKKYYLNRIKARC